MSREVRRRGRTLAVMAVLGLLVPVCALPLSAVRGPDSVAERRASFFLVFEQPARATLSGIVERAGKSVLQQLRSVVAFSRVGAGGMGAVALMCLGLAAVAGSRPCTVEGSLWRRGERAPPPITPA